tara:strand:+ start:398 stop:1153 length:756 start_codon:yes stop_codon:yes gene_type:complete
MKILIACEYSGIVRDAFIKKGHNAWSCDLLPSEGDPKNNHKHLQYDVNYALDLVDDWDMIIAFPPCTFLCSSGLRWINDPRHPNRHEDQRHALDLVKRIWAYDCKYICIENPIGILSSKFMKPSQYIQPYQFGHDASKKTCLWLKGLPKLVPTSDMTKEDVTYVTLNNGKRFSKWYYDCSKLPHSQRAKARSKFWEGVASAMADQWNIEPPKRLRLLPTNHICTNSYALKGSYKISLENFAKSQVIPFIRR